MNPLFLQPFLSLLSKDGFRINARDYRRISIALRADGAWTVEKMKAVLLALLVKNPHQEALFVRRFDSFFLDVSEGAWFDSGDDLDKAVAELKCVVEGAGKRSGFREGRPELAIGQHIDQPVPRPLPEAKWLSIKSLSPAQVKVGARDFTLTVLGDNFIPSARVFINGREVSALFKSPQEISATVPSVFTNLEGSASVVVRTEDGERFSNPALLKVEPKPDAAVEVSLMIGCVLLLVGVLTVFLTKTKEPEKKTPAPVNTAGTMTGEFLRPSPSPVPTVQKSPLAISFSQRLFAISCLAAFFLYCLYLFLLAKPPKDKPKTWNSRAPSNFRLEIIGGEPAARLDRHTLNRLAEALRYYESHDLSETLNIDASVEETSRSGGLPTLVYYRKKNIPTVVIAEDAYAEPTAWNSIARELAEGLRQRGIKTLYGKFFESPLHLYASNQTTYDLGRLEEQKNLLLLFFSDSKSFHEHNARALEVLSQWPGIAWMELRERKFWDEHTWRIAVHNIPVFQATAHDLLRAMPQISMERPPLKRRSAADWRGLALYSGGNLYTYVEYVLGDAFLWAQACAMIQPVTLGLADRLRLEFQPHLPAERMGRLFALPNTTYNKAGLSFSTPILSVLRHGFTIRWSEDAQRRILQFILERIREAKPSQTDSLADLSWEYVYERVHLEIEPDKALRKLTALQQTPLRDAINAEFRRLSLPLSEQDRDESGYRQVPLRRSPVTPDSWRRLAELTGSIRVPDEVADVFKKSLEYLKSMKYVIR